MNRTWRRSRDKENIGKNMTRNELEGYFARIRFYPDRTPLDRPMSTSDGLSDKMREWLERPIPSIDE